jgi:threonine dehydrogenase-like Zn-dependent dehydrogenase
MVGGGDRVAVVGPGPIGIVAALVASARGADRVVLVGRESNADRMRLAADLGVEVAIDVDVNVDVDVVVDTTGSSAAAAAGIGMLRRGGRFVTVGVGDDTFAVPWREALFKSADVMFSFSSGYEDWRAVLSLMRRGDLPAERLTTVFDLTDWERAFDAVADRRVTKALLRPER